MYIVADFGSCHMGKKTYAQELIRAAKDAGCDCVKAQIFDKSYEKGGNVCLPRDWVPELFNYAKEQGIPFTASAFDQNALEILFALDVPFIKFAYSKSRDPDPIQACLNIGKKVVVSTDDVGIKKLPVHENLACLYRMPGNTEETYPNRRMCNYEGLFPPFAGLSDHSPGLSEAVRATQFGAEWFEKHLTLPYNDITCPDGAFALKPKEMEKYVRAVRRGLEG